MRLLFTIGVAVCLRPAQAGGEVIRDFDLGDTQNNGKPNYPTSVTTGWSNRIQPPSVFTESNVNKWNHAASPTDVPVQAHNPLGSPPTHNFGRVGGPFKPRYDDWKSWRTAANKNKQLHWDVIMGTMYNSHIEKEQKTLERLSRDVQSQLNSMYLGKASAKGCQGRRKKITYDHDGDGYTDKPATTNVVETTYLTWTTQEQDTWCKKGKTPHACAKQGKGHTFERELATGKCSNTALSACRQSKSNCESATCSNAQWTPDMQTVNECPSCTTAVNRHNCGGCWDTTDGLNPFCKWNGNGHEDSPIQISMRDTKEAYEELVKCLKNSILNADYGSYLSLVQNTATGAGKIKVAEATAGAAAVTMADSTAFNKDADIVKKTEQAHYNLESSYKCSNEEMHFEVRLYKMSKLENRYKLLYLYCKCDLTTQIRKFAKMVETLCGATGKAGNAGSTFQFKTGHCYTSGSRGHGPLAKYYPIGKRDEAPGGSATKFNVFMNKIKTSQCDIAAEFCPEHVFYYRDDGVGAHPAADCSTCKDFGGDHSRITGTGTQQHRYRGIGPVTVPMIEHGGTTGNARSRWDNR